MLRAIACFYLLAVLPTLAHAQEKFIFGYPTELSYQPGDKVELHLSSTFEKLDMEIARIGAERRVVWGRKGVDGVRHETPRDASSRGCRWPATLTLDVAA